MLEILTFFVFNWLPCDGVPP